MAVLNATSSPVEGQEQQEPVVQVATATTAPPPSEGLETPAPEQKVTVPSELTAEQIEQILGRKDVQARMYQRAQAMKDKEIARERLQRQQEEETRRREEMDDEEYGSYTRAEEKRQETLRSGVAQHLGTLIGQMREQAVSVISNKKLREEMEAKASSFATFPEYVRACAKAEADHEVGLRVARREQELTESLTERIRAEQVEQLYPQLGTGLATGRQPDLHGESAIGAGLAAEMAKKRKQ